MRIGAVGHSVEPAFDQLIAKGLGVCDHVADVRFELWSLRLAKRNSFGGNHMH